VWERFLGGPPWPGGRGLGPQRRTNWEAKCRPCPRGQITSSLGNANRGGGESPSGGVYDAAGGGRRKLSLVVKKDDQWTLYGDCQKHSCEVKVFKTAGWMQRLREKLWETHPSGYGRKECCKKKKWPQGKKDAVFFIVG